VNESEISQESGGSVIRFHCKHCRQKIRVPKIHAGKKTKCPKCKNMVVVPKAESTGAVAPQAAHSDSTGASKDAAFALTFLDIPQEDKDADQRTLPDRTAEDLLELEQEIKTDEAEPVPKRKLPWPIDIFLYPISTPGLTILAIIVVITLLIDFVTTLFGPFGLFIWALGLVPNVVLFLYMYWYLCRCIHDSAEGGLRAPDVLVNAPSLGDMGWQTIRIAGCLAFFCAPVWFWAGSTGDTRKSSTGKCSRTICHSRASLPLPDWGGGNLLCHHFLIPVTCFRRYRPYANGDYVACRDSPNPAGLSAEF